MRDAGVEKIAVEIYDRWILLVVDIINGQCPIALPFSARFHLGFERERKIKPVVVGHTIAIPAGIQRNHSSTVRVSA